MNARTPALSAPRSSAAQDGVTRWLQAMEQRVAHLVALWRQPAPAPGLAQLVITDAEVDDLLADAPAQDATVPWHAGSLLAELRGWRAPAQLRRSFGLPAFDVEVLLAAAAVAADARFARLYAYLQDDVSRTRADAALLLRLLAPPSAHRALDERLQPDAPLRAWGLLQAEDTGRGAPLLRVADGALRHLLGRPGADLQVQPLLDDEPACALSRRLWSLRPEAARLAVLLKSPRAQAEAPRLVHLRGRAGSGRGAVARTAAEALQRALLVVDTRRMASAAEGINSAAQAAWREAQRLDATLVLNNADALTEDAERQVHWRALLRQWATRPGLELWLISEGPLPLDSWLPQTHIVALDLPAPAQPEREQAWQVALDSIQAPGAPGIEERAALARTLAAGYRTHHGEIAQATRRAAAALQQHSASARDPAAWATTLQRAAAMGAAPRLGRLGEPVPTRHSLQDLVLPPDKLDVLADLVRRVRHRAQVLHAWGFEAVSARGQGLVALFHGPSGTGKSMAADAVAHTLGMALYRIDLAGVVSKYIGETEKNLRAVFDEADRASAVLLFDEADALFGKRSEVKDAHDRYANIEINYLLQRIEQFDGIAILTTNKPAHLDDAFQRRIHVTLEFTLPRADERRRLWQRSFPRSAPLAEGIDWDFVAQHFELAGGTIRNAALGAAYLAAEAAQQAGPHSPAAIGQRELLLALRTELTKSGRRPAPAEFGPYQHLLSARTAMADASAPA
jgi:AAA+ superfamily predicted ATPase